MAKKPRIRFRALRALIGLLGASRETLLAWTPAAFGALRGYVISLLWISLMVFVLEMVTSAVLTVLGLATISIYTLVAMGFFYLIVLTYLSLLWDTLHAAGLLLSIDMGANIFEIVRSGHVRYDENEARLKLRYRGRNNAEYMLRFATLQFFIRFVRLVVNCLLNATWFLILVPAWYYPTKFAIGLFAGVTWLFAHKKFDFIWFEWFGTVVGVTGFTGVMASAVLDHYVHHPYPQIAIYVAFTIGFIWATDHTKKYTVGVALAGALALVISYFIGGIGPVGFHLGSERTIFRFGILVAIALFLVGTAILFFKELMTSPSHTSTSTH